MVSIKAVRSANSSFSTKSSSPVALFVGATAGIGLETLRALLQNTKSPKIYLVGRSKSKFAPTLEQLQQTNPSAKLIFIEAQISLLKEVERVCAQISSQESSLDLLNVSTGFLSFAGYEATSEGLTTPFAVVYYSRVLFMQRMTPLLNKSSDARVVSVLAAGQEASIIMDDMGMSNPKNYSLIAGAGQEAALMSLSMRQLSLENPKITYIHIYPGFVSSDVLAKLFGTMPSYLAPIGWFASWVMLPVINYFATTPEDAGQRGMYQLTNEKFSAGTGTNFYMIGEDTEQVKTVPQLKQYMEDGTQGKVWEHAQGVFERVISA